METKCGLGEPFFKASKRVTLDKTYVQIDEDLRNQYSLAYTPDKGNTIGYHKIHLTVPNQKDLVVTARDGYYYGQKQQRESVGPVRSNQLTRQDVDSGQPLQTASLVDGRDSKTPCGISP